jgi:hypothetical protein
MKVRMALILNPSIAEAKVSSPKKSRRQKPPSDGRIFTSVRRGFAFLVMMALMTVAYDNRDQLQNWVNSKVTRLMASATNFSNQRELRQSAVNHEHEVDQVTQ